MTGRLRDGRKEDFDPRMKRQPRVRIGRDLPTTRRFSFKVYIKLNERQTDELTNRYMINQRNKSMKAHSIVPIHMQFWRWFLSNK